MSVSKPFFLQNSTQEIAYLCNMALILHIETSTKNCSVSIAENGQLLALTAEHEDGYAHGEKLHQFVQWTLEGAECELQDLDAICVSKGPGSYTGLRIGVSAAKGFAYALEIPMMAINSLEIIATKHQNSDYDFIVPMIDARRMEVYTAIFDRDLKMVSSTEAKVIDEDSYVEYRDHKLLLVGDGAVKTQELLKHLNADFVAQFPSAEDMCALAYQRFLNEDFVDVAYFEPYYLKDFVAGKKKTEN